MAPTSKDGSRRGNCPLFARRQLRGVTEGRTADVCAKAIGGQVRCQQPR